MSADNEPIPMRLPCEACGELHIDEGDFATKPHDVHVCQHCGLTWKPCRLNTVGVRWLPGYKNDDPPAAVVKGWSTFQVGDLHYRVSADPPAVNVRWDVSADHPEVEREYADSDHFAAWNAVESQSGGVWSAGGRLRSTDLPEDREDRR